jgi:hypothetical protein
VTSIVVESEPLVKKNEAAHLKNSEKCQMCLEIKETTIKSGSTICPLIDCHPLVDHFENWKSHIE